MRIFIAFPCQKKVTQILDEFAKEFPTSVTGTFTKQYHCTLAFLGELDAAQIEHVHMLLSQMTFLRFRCALSSFGTFGEPPSILYAGIASEELIVLQSLITEKLTLEKREYIPHVTIVRIQNIKERALLERHITLQMPKFHFDVDEIVLYKSIMTKEGSIYEPLHSYLLEQPQKKVEKGYRLPPL